MEPRRSLRYYGSQETLASMLHIEPSPIDSEDDDQTLLEEDLAGSSSTATSSSLNKSSTSSTLGLSGSGHGAIYYCTTSPSPFSSPFSSPFPLCGLVGLKEERGEEETIHYV